MSNSTLVNYVAISPHSNNPRNNTIKKITIHHMAGDLTVEECGRVFQVREASSNYGIDSSGRVGMFVEEKNRSWASSSPNNDNQAVTIEVADDRGEPTWHVSDAAFAKLIDLCVDICKRNGIAKLNFTGDANGNLTMHRYFAQTACPGPYLASKFPEIAAKVNARLGGSKPSPVAPGVTPDIVLQANTGGSTWLPKTYGKDSNIYNEATGYAGQSGHTIKAVCASLTHADFKLEYSVHTIHGDQLPFVSSDKANIYDFNNGFAGITNVEIDGITMRLSGTSQYDVQYQVVLSSGHVLPAVLGSQTSEFAGIHGNTIRGITAKLIRK